MGRKKLNPLDVRLGTAAFDLGLMTKDQVDEINLRIILARTGSWSESTFGKEAVSLGYLTPRDLEEVEAEELRRRRLVAGYEIIGLIGTGNVSTAYHARQLAMDREVALKILHPHLASDPVFVQAYIAEAQAVSRFHHPNIVQGFDAGESNGYYYFAHEYLCGGSMADRLARGEAARFSETRLLDYLRQTNSALRHAWAWAVYHGDINPGNLLLDGEGHIKLANLGVPRVAGIRDMETAGPMPGFVRCGPEYAAPEQLDKPDLVDAATDMYNLGATFYHISFGVPPFVAPVGADLAGFRRDNPMPSFALESQEGFSAKYLRLLHDMLEEDPAQRPGSPEELADRLEAFHMNFPGDDLVGLARSVRRIAAPSARTSSRRFRTAAAPVADGNDRPFSLERRAEPDTVAPGVVWMGRGGIIALAVLVCALIAYYLA